MKLLIRIFTVLFLLLSFASSSQAGFYHVTVDTSALNIPPASGGAPFSLDFQFNDGGVLGNNTATISNFTYGGGSATGSATLLGGASGNIGSSVTFNNSSPFQELYQQFTPGVILGFDVSYSANLDGITPDALSFAILDTNLFNIPTSGLGDSLLLVNIDGATAAPQTFAGTGDYAGVSAAAVPEPATLALVSLALAGLGFRRRKLL